MTQAIGWFSSGLLLLTIASQISKQWQDRSARGVSIWLYIGQAAASTGFAVYSGLLHNWVFIVTNVALALAAVVGLGTTVLFKRKQHAAPERSETPA